MKYLVYTLLLPFLVVTSISCSNNTFETNEAEMANIMSKIGYLIFENHNTINELFSSPEKDNILSELPINSLQNGYNIEVVERQAIEKKTASNLEITISSTLAKLLNEDAMIQIEDKVYRFTRNWLFQTIPENADKLKNVDYLKGIIASMKSNRNFKAIVSSTYNHDDINVSPIQRGITSNNNFEDPCDDPINELGEPCVGGPNDGGGGGSGSAPCVEIDEDLNPGSHNYVYNYHHKRRGRFSTIFELSSNHVTAIASTQNLRRKKIILLPDTWVDEDANFINTYVSKIVLRRRIPGDPYSSEDITLLDFTPDMSIGGLVDTDFDKDEFDQFFDTGFEWSTRYIDSYHYIEEERDCLHKVTRVSRNDEVQPINFSY